MTRRVKRWCACKLYFGVSVCRANTWLSWVKETVRSRKERPNTATSTFSGRTHFFSSVGQEHIWQSALSVCLTLGLSNCMCTPVALMWCWCRKLLYRCSDSSWYFSCLEFLHTSLTLGWSGPFHIEAQKIFQTQVLPSGSVQHCRCSTGELLLWSLRRSCAHPRTVLLLTKCHQEDDEFPFKSGSFHSFFLMSSQGVFMLQLVFYYFFHLSLHRMLCDNVWKNVECNYEPLCFSKLKMIP